MNHLKLILIFCLSVLFINMTSAQKKSPYSLKLEREIALIGGGALMLGIGQNMGKKIKPFTREELLKSPMDRNDVLFFDRGATYNYSGTARDVSDVLLYSSFALPFATLGSKKMRKDQFAITVMLVETMLLTDGLTSMTKSLVKRPRPFVYNPDVPIEAKLEPNAKKSFFSGHTSSTAALSFFTAKVITDYYPDSELKPVIWTAAALIPAATGYMRYKGGKHFLSDVLVGYGIGALAGYFIPELHKTKDGKPNPVQIHAGSKTLGLTYTF